MVDDWTPRAFWKEAALIVAQAESEHAATKQQNADKQRLGSGQNPAQGKAGSTLRR